VNEERRVNERKEMKKKKERWKAKKKKKKKKKKERKKELTYHECSGEQRQGRLQKTSQDHRQNQKEIELKCKRLNKKSIVPY
jgi:hypothetical protein